LSLIIRFLGLLDWHCSSK